MNNKPFPDCGLEPLGLYPIVDSVAWAQQLLPLGITTIQLRIKNKNEAELAAAIQQSVVLAQQFQARLFVNDYWQLAIQHGAYGVHLGQEDLDQADIKAIYQAGLRLGISTHSVAEVARACELQPSYIAFGPIYPTTSKPMAFGPQGVEQLRDWRKILNYPLVAIGGINKERLPDVLATGVDGVALISAITQAEKPLEAARELLKIIREKHENILSCN